MLAKRRSLKIGRTEVERTPLLVPSFSSKGFPEIGKILQTAEEFIDGPILVSAYDIFYEKIEAPSFPPSLFLDSGGYEASKDADLSDLGEHEHEPNATWGLDAYKRVVGGWDSSVPTFIISYDHPKERLAVEGQIARARNCVLAGGMIGRGLLLKPETEAQRFLKVESVISHIHELAEFELVAFTEKEIGSSIFDRMKNIAKMRIALGKAGLDIPIHIFGSLDTISTIFYFVAGADIFDGLTWLRFAYRDGLTLYRQNYSALECGLSTKGHMIDALCWSSNWRYLCSQQRAMRSFLRKGDFSVFGHHGSVIREAYNSLAEEVGV